MEKNKTIRANARLERKVIEGMDLPYFKITFSNDGKSYRVVPNGKFNGKIFESLQELYIEEGKDRKTATLDANKTIIDFYRAAHKCSEGGQRPFKVYAK